MQHFNTSAMKKTSYIIILISVLMFACSESFLDETPKNQVSLESFYDNSTEAETGLIGVYSRVISKYNCLNLFYFTVSSDEMTANAHAQSGFGSGDHREISNPGNYGMENCYLKYYIGIANANLLLQKVPDIPDGQFSGTRKDEIIGEAFFLRGYAYYMLAMAYRDVPITIVVPTSTKPEDNYLAKSPQAEVLDQAMSDFRSAISIMPDKIGAATNMPDEEVRGRGSKWVAKAFKARVHLWREQWDSAYAECQDIIEYGGYPMATRWINIFAGENNDPEVIWQSQGQSRAEYNFMGIYRWFCDAEPDNPDPQFMIEKGTTDMFEQPYKDVRLEYSVRAIGRAGVDANYGGRMVKFFHVPSGLIVPGSDESRDKNFPLMRMAEINLMKAEAIVQSGYILGTKDEVLDILNTLRARAADPEFDPREEDKRYDYATDPGTTGIPQLTIDNVSLDAVKDEKRRELAFEGIRWIDLLRWDKENNYAYVLSITNTDDINRLYTPIPQTEINANRLLEQNAGYE
jgi:hypothetical protein